MGRLKDKLLDLEEQGIIKWSDDEAYYVRVGDDSEEPFDLAEYLSTVVIDTKTKKLSRIDTIGLNGNDGKHYKEIYQFPYVVYDPCSYKLLVHLRGSKSICDKYAAMSRYLKSVSIEQYKKL